LLLLLSAAACKDKAADNKAIDAGVAAGTVSPNAGLPLAEQLDREAANRPKVPITAEKVIDTFGAAGFNIIEQKQVLGATVNARYCKNAQIPAYTIILVVCEYATPEAATRGREVSLTKFKGQKNRETFVNGSTTLTLVSTRALPSGDEWGKKLIEAFQKL
jgi:hypothetical protein